MGGGISTAAEWRAKLNTEGYRQELYKNVVAEVIRKSKRSVSQLLTPFRVHSHQCVEIQKQHAGQDQELGNSESLCGLFF
jgi:hypothetical protein